MATFLIGADGGDDYTDWTTMQLTESEAAGDTVSFRKAETFRETVTVPASGSSGSVITYTAHGTGADPIINGADLVTTWTAHSGSDTATIVADLDDGHLDSNPTFVDTNFLTVGDAGGTHYKPGMVFHGLAVPKDATIDSSKITFTSIANLSGTTANWRVFGENDANPSAFVDDADFKTRDDNLSTAYADWDNVVAWTASTTYDSPSLNTIVSEITSLAGWASGNNIAFFINDNSADANSYRQCYARGNGNTANLEVLAVDWSFTNVWKATVTTEPEIVLFDGTVGTNVASAVLCNGANKWFWDSDVLYVYYTEDPDGAVAIEAGIRDYCIYGLDKDYITVENLDLKYANIHNIYLSAGPGGGATCTGWTIDSNTIQKATQDGINEGGAGNALNCTISNNTINNNGRTGVNVAPNGTVTGWAVNDNTIHSNAWNEAYDYGSGIKFYGAAVASCTIETNAVYSNGVGVSNDSGYGIWLDTCGATMIVRYNNVYSNNKKGIWIEKTSGASVYYNIVRDHIVTTDSTYGVGIDVGTTTDGNEIYNNVVENCVRGIVVRGDNTAADCLNNVVKNNIAVSCTYELDVYWGGENDGTNGSGNVYTYNCFGAEAANMVLWGFAAKDTYDAWETSYGSSTFSVESDPLFTNQTTHDFTLQTTSPCINAGTDVSLTVDYSGEAVAPPPDIGAYETDISSMGGGLGMNMFMGMGLK